MLQKNLLIQTIYKGIHYIIIQAHKYVLIYTQAIQTFSPFFAIHQG